MDKLLKGKGAANTNHDNQHNILCVEIRVKLKTQEATNKLDKHINFDINLLKENTQQLLTNDENQERKIIEKEAINIALSRIDDAQQYTN